MGTILLISTLFLQESEAMLVRRYGKKHSAGLFFNAMLCLFATLFFVITDQDGISFSTELLLYGGVSAFLYAGGFYYMYLALQQGSFIGTKMISSFSIVVSVCYGLFFLQEDIKFTAYIAIVLIFFSVFMLVWKKSEQKKERVSARWLIYATLSALCNGFIAVVSKSQQIYFEGACDKEFMFLSFLGASLFLLVFAFIKERENFKDAVKTGFLYGAGGGLLNGAKNLFLLLLYLYLPVSVAVPLRTGLGYILSFLISAFLYKEPFTKMQISGIAVGVLAILLFQL